MQLDARSRLTAAQALKHPWIIENAEDSDPEVNQSLFEAVLDYIGLQMRLQSEYDILREISLEP